jgi:hypothetical protein
MTERDIQAQVMSRESLSHALTAKMSYLENGEQDSIGTGKWKPHLYLGLPTFYMATKKMDESDDERGECIDYDVCQASRCPDDRQPKRPDMNMVTSWRCQEAELEDEKRGD